MLQKKYKLLVEVINIQILDLANCLGNLFVRVMATEEYV